MTTNDDKVARKAKVLSMLWKTPGLPIEELSAGIEDVHIAVCELYGVDPVVGFQMKTTG